MRFTGAIACAIIALDCCEKATGETAQTLFAAQHLWVWWIVAALWGVSCLKFVFGWRE